MGQGKVGDGTSVDFIELEEDTETGVPRMVCAGSGKM